MPVFMNLFMEITQKKLFRHVICCDYTRTTRVTIKQMSCTLLLSTEAHTRIHEKVCT